MPELIKKIVYLKRTIFFLIMKIKNKMIEYISDLVVNNV